MQQTYQYESDWIHTLETEVHWRDYWLQQKILSGELSNHDTILEIGKGTGFCSDYLKSKGYKITTIDIDRAKKPDIVGNIIDYEFPELFDHVIAFEVFEHIPFDLLGRVIAKIKKCFRKSFIISIPEGSVSLLQADLRLPIIKHIRFGIRLQQRFLPAFLRIKLSKYHHWELNYKNEYSLKSVKKIFDQEGLKVELHVRSHFNNHNFLVVKAK